MLKKEKPVSSPARFAKFNVLLSQEDIEMKTSEELRAFVFGTVFGMIGLSGAVALACWIANVKFVPVIGS